MTEDEMVGRHHQFNGHELGQTPGDCEGQGRLACYSPWGHKESVMTWRLSNNKGKISLPSNFLRKPCTKGKIAIRTTTPHPVLSYALFCLSC